MYATHRHDLFCITIKYHKKYFKRFSSYGADTKLHLKPSRENNSNSESESCHSCHDLFYITVKYHDYIPKGFQVMERPRNCI